MLAFHRSNSQQLSITSYSSTISSQTSPLKKPLNLKRFPTIGHPNPPKSPNPGLLRKNSSRTIPDKDTEYTFPPYEQIIILSHVVTYQAKHGSIDEEVRQLQERKRREHSNDSIFTSPKVLGTLCLVLLLMLFYAEEFQV